MNVTFDPKHSICVECGDSYEQPTRTQGGGTVKIYCSPKCRANSWARGNTEKRKVSVIKYDAKPESKEKKRARSRASRFAKYGLTEDFVTELLVHQGHSCRGCYTDLDIDSARIDHCHAAEAEGLMKVRGLLCDRCNWALGHAKDSSDILRNLAEYLDEQSALPRG